MTNEHLVSEAIDDYLGGRLGGEGIVALHAHTEGCAECRTRLAAAADARARAGAAHLTEQEIVEFAARISRPGWAVEHVANCAVCGAALQDLEGFARESQGRGGRSLVPAWALVLAASVLMAAAIGVGVVHRSPGRPVEMGRLLMDSGGPVTLATAVPEPDLVREALRTGRLPAGPAPFAGAPDVLRGAPNGAGGVPPAIAIAAPSGVRVASDQPRFSWTGCAGGSFEVQIFDMDLNPVLRSPRVEGLEWQAGEALGRGRQYLWQVAGRCGGRAFTAPAPPAPPARFEVVSEAVVRRIAGAGSSHLALAVVYASEGMNAEASRELDVLERMNPDSALVASLHKSLASK